MFENYENSFSDLKRPSEISEIFFLNKRKFTAEFIEQKKEIWIVAIAKF